MTNEKAIEMVQNLRNCELEAIKIMKLDDHIADTMRRISKGKADYLGQILHEIEPQTYPCDHPKIWNDVCDGQLYCMGCNENL